MCFIWISEQTAIISLYSINWLVFITETECVYGVWAVRTGSLNRIRAIFLGLKFTVELWWKGYICLKNANYTDVYMCTCLHVYWLFDGYYWLQADKTHNSVFPLRSLVTFLNAGFTLTGVQTRDGSTIEIKDDSQQTTYIRILCWSSVVKCK
jgi:hypothetical protein